MYQSNQLSHGYPKNNEKRIYQVDNKAIKDQPEGFHIIFDVKGEYVTYSDEGFHEVVVNFFGIETFYSKCHSSFSSKSKLYKHIKAGYIEGVLPFFSTQPSLSISVIASMVVYQVFGSGLAF